jgi:hypothetical protein
MKLILFIAGCALLAWSASASDVYVVTDSKGNRVYTDRPEQLPAEKVAIRTVATDATDAQRPASSPIAARQPAQRSADSDATQDQTAKAEQLTADDLAKRCADARHRYEAAMNAPRLYEQGADGVRRYLSPEETTAARSNAKQTMDAFCGGQ